MTAAAITHTGVSRLIRNRHEQPIRAAAVLTMKEVWIAANLQCSPCARTLLG